VDPGPGTEELRIVIDGEEGTISDVDWTEADATVVCREINSTYTKGIPVYSRYSTNCTPDISHWYSKCTPVRKQTLSLLLV